MSNTIYQPSPRYQTQFPLESWQNTPSSRPFYSSFQPPQYADETQEDPSHIHDDSGYGSLSRKSTHRQQQQQQRYPQVEFQSPESTSSATVIGQDDDEYADLGYRKPQRYADPSYEDPRRRPSIHVATIPSPELVHPRPAPNYLTMRPPTPPASNTSLRSYLRRFKTLASFVKSLPWTTQGDAPCTANYYPAASSRATHHLAHRPMIIWHHRHFRHPSTVQAFYDDSSIEDGEEGEDGEWERDSMYLAGEVGHYQESSALNLADEFDEPVRRRSGVSEVPRPGQRTQVDLSREFSEARPRRDDRRRRSAREDWDEGEGGPRYPGGYVRYSDLPAQQGGVHSRY